jgi:hypothetical protein
MDKFTKDLNNEIEKEINEYFLRKKPIKIHNQPVYIDTNHTQKLVINIEPVEISLDDILSEASFQKDVKGQIEFMKNIEGGSSMTSLEFKFAKTSIRYEPTMKQFEIELGAEFFY